MEILEKAYEWVADSDLETSTLERYCYSLGQFARWGVTAVEQIDRPTVTKFMRARKASGVAAATANRDLAAISSFVGWLCASGEFAHPALLELRESYLSLPPPPPPEFLTAERFVSLRRAAADVHEQLELGVAIDIHTGLRLAELRRLWHDDFFLDVELPYVRIRRDRGRENKTRRDRTVPLRRAFADELLACGFPCRPGPVFPSRHRRGESVRSPYTVTSTMQRWLWEAERISGVTATWIMLRHTFASWHVQEGTEATLGLVAKWLGNSIRVCYDHYAGLVPGGDPRIEGGFRGLGRAEEA